MEKIMISARSLNYLTKKPSLLSLGMLFVLSFTQLGCTSQTPKPAQQLDPQLTQAGKIIDLDSGKSITPQQLIQELAASPRVIVGEKHDNIYHHQIEQWVAQEMQQIRPQGAVLLEMLTPDQQSRVNNVQKQMQGNPYIRDEKLQEILHWNSGWPWAQYGELVKYLLAQPSPVLAANINRDAVLKAYDNPPTITGTHSTQPVIQELISETIKRSHNGELDDKQAKKMLVIQQLRDRAMAQGLLDAPAPALLFAGGYHATRAIGVPLHMLDLAPDEPLKVLIISEQGEEIDNLHADYVWYTPK
ncbi:ChaN family lipoprotein [Providencia sp. JUb39]|nr:ChaN family lipoprotein [Providencia alcalifaciens]MBC5790683.1 ChaN family lipoprotein [Providencia sp. JUb39]